MSSRAQTSSTRWQMPPMGSPTLSEVAAALLLGFVSYGLSLYLYISAQAALGASRVSAYYASAPFIGAVLSLAILGESLSRTYLVALVVMAAGAAIMTWDTLRPDPGDPDQPGPGEGALRRPVRVRRRTS